MEKYAQVSVVICTYNGERFLREQIESILNQTYKLQEIIIVDDCSVDNTLLIIEDYAKSNRIIKYYQNHHNVGFTKNFEKALTLASGDFIALSDQDDIWKHDKIEKLVCSIPVNSLLIYCDSIRFTGDIPNSPVSNPKYKRFEGSDIRKLSFFNTVSGHAVLIKKELLNLSLPVPSGVIYDWWLAAVATCNGGISYIKEILVYQRIHASNATTNNGFNHSDPKQIKAFKKMVGQHAKAFKVIPNIAESDKIFFEKLHLLLLRSSKRNFDLELFIFLMKNRNKIYNYKVRVIGFFSHLKHSINLSTCRF